ncbi:MAG: hypothetical protein ABSF77_19720 [Spirochaetia bacterium]|jgi:hypothetical protein
MKKKGGKQLSLDEWANQYFKKREKERLPSGFLDLAVRAVRGVALEAEIAAKKRNATAKSVLRAVLKNLPRRVSDLRAAGHSELGLQLPTMDEAMEQGPQQEAIEGKPGFLKWRITKV